MNYIEVLGGGFPGTSKTWRFVRDMIGEVHALAVAMGGENCIVKGCEVNNGVAADGIVILGGEAYPFIGGAVQAYVKVVESVEAVEYFNDSEADGQADVNDAYFTKHVEFSDAGTPWAEMKRISSLSEISRRIPPKQCPQPFWGAVNTIPDGWQLCDGSNGTPDLRGMFIAGYDPAQTDQNAPGKTGGEHKVTLTKDQIPAHNHAGNTGYGGYHNHNIYVKLHNENGAPASKGSGDIASGGPEYEDNSTWQTASGGGHTHAFTTNNEGGGQSHENRPKFYTMAWIAYVG